MKITAGCKCRRCGCEFTGLARRIYYCVDCHAERRAIARKQWEPRQCKGCGVTFTPKGHNTRHHSRACLKAYNWRTSWMVRHARKRWGAKYEVIDPLKVLARAGWRCQLCGCPTPESLRGTQQPNAPEVDHIVALASGGTHTLDNVQCACRQCNRAKGSGTLAEFLESLTGLQKALTCVPC